MIDENQIQARVRVLAEGSPPPDLLDRAMAQAARIRRRRLGLIGALTTAAVVAGSFATGSALASRGDAGPSSTTDQPTATITDGEIPADLTGKALADALGLPSVGPCGGLIMETGTSTYLCIPKGPSSLDRWLLVYQLQGYERTATVMQLAEALAEMDELARDDEPYADPVRGLMERRNALLDQLYDEQGRQPYTGWESPEDSAQPTSTD